MKVAILSSGRAKTCAEKTVALLVKYAPDLLAETTVFVGEERDRTRYEDALRGRPVRVQVACMGRARQWNYMRAYYPEAEHVLLLGDDLTGVSLRVCNRSTVNYAHGIKALAADGFRVCQDSGARLWGLCPTDDPDEMRENSTLDLRFISGQLCGFINSRDHRLTLCLEGVEDYERTCRFYALDGRVVRLNYAAPQWTRPDAARTCNRVRAAAEELAEMFPDYVKLTERKTLGQVLIDLREPKQPKRKGR